jgi:hypothetical protein
MPPASRERAGGGDNAPDGATAETAGSAAPPLPPFGGISSVTTSAAPPPPAFRASSASRRRGPMQLRFHVPVSERTYDLPVGLAEFVYRPGQTFAGEWRVAPWQYPGWLPDSVDCGEAGTAVIGGHVSWYEEPGPFAEIAWLEPGDLIQCRSQRGEWHTYQITGVWTTTYDDAVSWRLSPQQGEGNAILSLFTCTPEITGINFVRAELVTGDTEDEDIYSRAGSSE